MRIWAEPFTPLRVPKLFNLRTDPFEFADVTSNTYYEWFIRHVYFMCYIKEVAAEFAMTFVEFPPAQHPDTFTIDEALAKLSAGAGSAGGEAH
jgi:arylsulfatase